MLEKMARPSSTAATIGGEVVVGQHDVGGLLGHVGSCDAHRHHVKTNLVSTGLAALVNVAGSALVTGREATRHGNSHATIEPYRSFEASDGAFLLAVGTDRQFEALCKKVPRPRGTRERRALLDQCRARREPRGARPDPRGSLRGEAPRDLAERLQGRGHPRRARRGRARSAALRPGDGAGVGSSDLARRAVGAHGAPPVLPAGLRRARTRGPSAPRRGHEEALRRGRPSRAALGGITSLAERGGLQATRGQAGDPAHGSDILQSP